MDLLYLLEIWVNINHYIFVAEDSKAASIVDVYATKGVSDGLNGKIMVILLAHQLQFPIFS